MTLDAARLAAIARIDAALNVAGVEKRHRCPSCSSAAELVPVRFLVDVPTWGPAGTLLDLCVGCVTAPAAAELVVVLR